MKFLRSLRFLPAALAALIFSAGISYALYSTTFDRITVGSTTAPALTSCGTSPAITGTDFAGIVTMGTGTPTGCVITFNSPFAAAPVCVANWMTGILAAESYTVSATAITLTQTGTNSTKVSYVCVGQNGG